MANGSEPTFLYLLKYLNIKLNSSLKYFPNSSFHSLMHLMAKISKSAANFFGGGKDRPVQSMLIVSFMRTDKLTITNFLKYSNCLKQTQLLVIRVDIYYSGVIWGRRE